MHLYYFYSAFCITISLLHTDPQTAVGTPSGTTPTAGNFKASLNALVLTVPLGKLNICVKRCLQSWHVVILKKLSVRFLNVSCQPGDVYHHVAGQF
jgi:hypothetical protein